MFSLQVLVSVLYVQSTCVGECLVCSVFVVGECLECFVFMCW